MKEESILDPGGGTGKLQIYYYFYPYHPVAARYVKSQRIIVLLGITIFLLKRFVGF
jgi:hypothetical protein